MLCIYNTSTNPYFNLATEEYLIKNFQDDIFMLWRNEPAIIVGKHQNTLAEINVDYVKENQIKVVRRLSGGGAVFHDLGNLNFTFIISDEKEGQMNFKKFTQPILDVLQQMGIDARFEGRNDLTIDGRKFSGNAEHIWKNRVLHHGTLLFSAEMADLTAALKVSEAKFSDKAVKSVRSRVTNISEHLKEPMTVMEFAEKIMKYIMSTYSDSVKHDLDETDIQAIQKLVDEKYGTWEWNFGYSPKYNFSKTVKINAGTLEIELDVQNGIIQQAKIFGDYFNTLPTENFENMLCGLPHEPEALRNMLDTINIGSYIRNATNEEILEALF